MAETVRQHDPASGVHYRLRPALAPSDPSFILLHGLTGDEDAMWVLTSALPGDGLIAAARGLYSIDDDGYSWVQPAEVGRESLSSTVWAAEAVERWIEHLILKHGLAVERTVLVGFSQGSGLAFALAERGRIRPAAVVALAGFLPKGEYTNLGGLPVFWGHGTLDERVPIGRARRQAERLKRLGANVRFCEAEVGHKVGVECMRGLEDWLAGCLPVEGA